MNTMKFRYLRDKQKIIPRLKLHTDDPQFRACESKFLKENENIKDLKKHLDSFAVGIRNLISCITSMYESFSNIYDTSWYGCGAFNQACKESVKAWQIYLEEFKINILANIESYASEFPRVKRYLEKRNKKATEFQKCMYFHESVRKSKKVDDLKLKKTKDDMDIAQKEYKDENDVALQELPNFINHRLELYITIWNSLFLCEEKLFRKLLLERSSQKDVLEKLKQHADNNEYDILKQTEYITNLSKNNSFTQSSFSLYNDKPNGAGVLGNGAGGGSVWNLSSSTGADETSLSFNGSTGPSQSSAINPQGSLSRTRSYQVSKQLEPHVYDLISKPIGLKKQISFDSKLEETSETMIVNEPVSVEPVVELRPLPDPGSVVNDKGNEEDEHSDVDIDQAIRNSDSSSYVYSRINKTKLSTESGREVSPPVSHSSAASASKMSTPAINISSSINSRASGEKQNAVDHVSDNRFYYQVTVKYNYSSQDNDELDLRRDEVILVLPWESEDQIEDGWLFGENVITKQKGLFPANHTTRL